MTIVKVISEPDTNRLFPEIEKIISLAVDVGHWEIKFIRLKTNAQCAVAVICFTGDKGNKFPILD